MNEYISGCVQPGTSRSRVDPRNGIEAEGKGFSAELIQNGGKRIVGVIGLGSVGRALKTVMGYFYEVKGYDIKGRHSWTQILGCEVVFVCVQTPQDSNGRLDCSHVTEVLARLAESRYPGVVVIKSTLGIGFMSEVTARFRNLRLIYSPEFLREKSALVWTASPDRLVLSGDSREVNFVKEIYHWVEDAVILVTDYATAELGKLLHNAYIALKVSFSNSAELMATLIGADPEIALNIVSSDRRVKSKEHLMPFKGPFGGKCVPKDTAELTHYFGEEATLIRAAEEFNEFFRKHRNLLNLHTEVARHDQ